MTDKSPYASEMQLKLSTISPGESIEFVQIPKDNVEKTTFLSSLFFGSPSEYTNIPISLNQKLKL